MSQHNYINGFSKLTNDEKIWLIAVSSGRSIDDFSAIDIFRMQDKELQNRLEEISENVVSNYFLPYSIAPNFLINGKMYFVPMVIEESSVVAAASAAAKFWFNKGGFTSRVISTVKIGQVHFTWDGKFEMLQASYDALKETLLHSAAPLLENMKKRGGGVTDIELLNFTDKIPSYYQVRVSFETADAMGANIINSVLEEMAKVLPDFLRENIDEQSSCEIIMAILSNHTPDSIVECTVECDIEKLAEISGGFSPREYALKFKTAVDIANIDPYRATTHNKGIYNGIDAVVLATGNDFRAVEACGHSYASRYGHYKSLTTAEVTDKKFKYTLKVPMALGTVGGLTTVHPLAKLSLEILGNPSAKELMEITAAAGLANTFSAVKALTTSGIQKGHMRFHLNNILNALNATDKQKALATEYFKDKKVSHKAVQDFLASV